MAGDFLDTNVLVYAFTDDPRAAAAQALMERGCIIGVQTLNEFANVGRRKLRLSWPELHDALAVLKTLCPTVVPMDFDTHEDALVIAERHGYSIFDSLIVAAALRAGCSTLWTEEMQDGAVIERRLRIANPFRGA